MKIQTTVIDGATYTRVACAICKDEGQKRAFKDKKLCQIGTEEDAFAIAGALEETGRKSKLMYLTWFRHDNLREPILSEALFPSTARIILVKAK